jgi:hypothetical protein
MKRRKRGRGIEEVVKKSKKSIWREKKGEKRGEKGTEREGVMCCKRREKVRVGERTENHPLRAKFGNCIGWLL